MIRLAVLACLCAAPALAQDFDCANAEAQQELNACAQIDWEVADVALNDAYTLAIAAMQEMDSYQPTELAGAEDALRTAQRAWITYRDANCIAAGFPMRGGSAEPLLVFGCMRRMTEARTAELLDLMAY